MKVYHQENQLFADNMNTFISFPEHITPNFNDAYDRITLVSQDHIEAYFIRPQIEKNKSDKFVIVVKTNGGSKYTINMEFNSIVEAEKYIDSLY